MSITVDATRAAVEKVRAIRHDPELAHGMEDDLYKIVLEFIATGSCGNPEKIAKIALETQDIEFPRWCS